MSLFWLHFYVNKLDSALSSKFTLALMGRYEHKMDSDDIVDRLRYVAGYFDIAGDVRIEKGARLCVSIDRPLESRANLMRIKEMFGGLVLPATRGRCAWKIYATTPNASFAMSSPTLGSRSGS